MRQAEAFYTQAKTWLGVTGVPDGFLEKTLPEWFGYFQGVLAKNDDGDVRTDEFCYGKVGLLCAPATLIRHSNSRSATWQCSRPSMRWWRCMAAPSCAPSPSSRSSTTRSPCAYVPACMHAGLSPAQPRIDRYLSTRGNK